MSQRYYHCPVLPLGSCDWGGPLEDFSLHFEVNHRKLRSQKIVFQNKYDQIWCCGPINVQENNEENRLLIYSEEIFLLQLKVDIAKEKLWAGVRHIGKPENEVKFQYRMLIGSEIRSIKSEKTGVVQRDDDWGFDVQSMLEFDLSPVTEAAIKMIPYCLRIYHPEMRTSFVISELKCVMCKNSFSPPAFACQKGHLVCMHCKRRDNQCGYVASASCNLMVENISHQVLYPCKNESFGCNLALSKFKIGFHEEQCFVLISCFAAKECQFVGIAYDWWYHLLEKHPDTVSVLHQDHWYDIRETHCQIVFIRKNAVFRIMSERKHAEDSFVWSCQQLGLKPGDEPLFELDIKTVDPKNPKAESIGTVSCCPLIQQDDKATEHCIIPSDTLFPFIVADHKICIRFYIRKIEK